MRIMRADAGERVFVHYHGNYVWGVVRESRVKYGGELQYTVDLDRPLNTRWRSEPARQILVSHDDITC